MAQKRPFEDEVVNEASSKHPRHTGASGDMVLCNGSSSIDGAPDKPCDAGEASSGKNETEFKRHENGSCPTESLRETVEDIETDVLRSASLSHWATSSTSDEDEPPEELVRLPLLLNYFSFDSHVRSAINADDVYYSLLDYPPRKAVAIGPEHQAEIPGWSDLGKVNASDASEKSEPGTSDRVSFKTDDDQLVAICIMPSPEIESRAYNGEKVGDGRTDCSCTDQGSIRCVQQHVSEARDKLRMTLGRDTFMELGFYDMGEVVAGKWSEEEEQLFHEVVYSNPASLGKNFWNILSAVFPSRTKMEIVSYYFNVFILRKRAQQNRFNPMNIDSDNDEWQGIDDHAGNEGVISGDDNSGVESPALHGSLELYKNDLHNNEDEHEEEDDDGDLSDEVRETNGSNGDGVSRKSNLDSTSELPYQKSVDDGVENDVHDGSCTSSDSGSSVQRNQSKPDGCRGWLGYGLESTDAKTWDGYNMNCPNNKEDFLPTRSMIEEVFGDGDLESKSK